MLFFSSTCCERQKSGILRKIGGCCVGWQETVMDYSKWDKLELDEDEELRNLDVGECLSIA